MRYEALGKARYHVEREGVREWIRVPARRNWFILLFLGFWLAMWTIGGVLAIGALMSDFEPFLLFWLGGWALGWLVAASMVAWQLGGAELIEVSGGDLIRTVRMPGYRQRRAYRGSEVRDLKAAAAVAAPFGMNAYPAPYPPLFRTSGGSVTFRYGARTEYLGAGLDEAEGEGIVAWLRGRLPGGVG